MKTRPAVSRVLFAFLAVFLSTSAFHAQSASPGHTLTFAELTYGSSINAMGRDRAGNVWFAGTTVSHALPTTADALQRTAPAAASNGVFGRMRPDGTVTYLSYLGASQYTFVNALAIDGSDNVYLTGYTYSPDFPTTAGAYDRTCGADGSCQTMKTVGGRPMLMSAADGFVVKLPPAADRLLYSTFVGGQTDDWIFAMAVDASGRVHLAGGTTSDDFPVTAGALQSAWTQSWDNDNARIEDGFYARLSADGSSLQYGTYLGGYGYDDGFGLAVNASGDAFVAGTTTSPNFPTVNAVQPTNASAAYPWFYNPDTWLARFSASGAAYATYMGGSSGDMAKAIAVVDAVVYVAGRTCSADFPGVTAGSTECRAFVTAADAATGAVLQTTALHAAGGLDIANALAVDADHVAYVTGATSDGTFPTTPDAYQRTSGGDSDAFISILDMSGPEAPSLLYSTHLGGTSADVGQAIAPDGSGGAFVGGGTGSLSTSFSFPSHNAAQTEPAPEASNTRTNAVNSSFAARVAAGAAGSSGNIVLYAKDASAIAGAWQLVADPTAAAGTRIWNPDAAAPKLASAAANPANYFDLTFQADAGVPYHLWLRMKADADSWTNDSVFVQFSDGVDGSGNPLWRVGSTSATVVSLEDCSGCGEQGWGWNDNGYNTSGTLVSFATGGTHTIRVQQREDGISIDQVVLSSGADIDTAPGANRNDTTIVPPSTAPPPPTTDPNEVVVYAGDSPSTAGTWQLVGDATAAGGKRLWNPDTGVAKIAAAAAAPANYVDLTFNAQAGVAYHLWLRMKADGDSWTNDSVFVQFSDSVDGSGSSTWRIGSTSATVVSLEDCSGCGEQGWGWNDNGYSAPGVPVTFATSGPHTIRIQQREDGVSIDQVVLSAVKYVNAAPGAAKNDATFVAK